MRQRALAVLVLCSGVTFLLGRDRPFASIANPAAMAAAPDGSLVAGELDTGRIVRIDPAGGDATVARVEVRTDGQRGLVGLAVRGTEVFASWVRPDGRLIVARVAPERTVWVGPQTARLGNGGHIAFDRSGRLLIGVGDLQDPPRVADPAAPNGKLLALDPDGDTVQTPEVLAGGWNNPFAFDVAPDGTVWVADNAPGTRPERLAVVTADGTVDVLAELPRVAPSGIVVLDGRAVVCGYVSRTLHLYQDGALTDLGVQCRLGVVRTADGRLAVARDDTIRVIDLPTFGAARP